METSTSTVSTSSARGTADTEDLFNRLNLPNRPETERTSGTHAPATNDIFLGKKLGEGTFRVVIHIWNVSTEEAYAVCEALRERAFKEIIQWYKQAARIMERI
jgi:hypothetical protein